MSENKHHLAEAFKLWLDNTEGLENYIGRFTEDFEDVEGLPTPSVIRDWVENTLTSDFHLLIGLDEFNPNMFLSELISKIEYEIIEAYAYDITQEIDEALQQRAFIRMVEDTNYNGIISYESDGYWSKYCNVDIGNGEERVVYFAGIEGMPSHYNRNFKTINEAYRHFKRNDFDIRNFDYVTE